MKKIKFIVLLGTDIKKGIFMKKINLKTNTKLILAVVAAVVVSTLSVALIGNAAGLFTKPLDEITLRDRNEENILMGNFSDYNAGNGVQATMNKDTSIKLSGTNKSGEDIEILVEQVTLEAGTYSLWGAPNGGRQTYHILLRTNDGQEIVSDFDGNSFVLESKQSVSVYIVVCDEVTVYTTVRPVLCKGAAEVDFYA